MRRKRKHITAGAIFSAIKKGLAAPKALSVNSLKPLHAVLFSAPFLGFGTWIMGMGLGYFPLSETSDDVTPDVVIASGAIFFSAGLAVFYGGIKKIILARRIESRKFVEGGTPWTYDFPTQGPVVKSRGPEFISTVIGFGTFLGLIGMLNWVAFYAEDADEGFFYAALLANAITGIIIIRTLFLLLRRLVLGATRVVCSSFPLHLGSQIYLKVSGVPRTAVTKGEFLLRCAEEEYTVVKSGRSSTHVVKVHVIHEFKFGPKDMQASPDGAIVLACQLPNDQQFRSAVSDRPAKFWELMIHIQRSGLDYKEAFILPIY